MTLRAVGSILVAEDPVGRTDVVVVGLNTGESGVLEAADLVNQGLAGRVVVLTEPPGEAAAELTRRGLPFDDPGARLLLILRLLGVKRADALRLPDGGTEVSARTLAEWAASQEIHSMILVAEADHSRRFRRVLRRRMAGTSKRVAVRISRYGDFDVDNWWKTRDGVRTAIVELEKLLLEIVRHPLS